MIKCEACQRCYNFFAMSLINLIIHNHECKILFILSLFGVIAVFVMENAMFLLNICDVVMGFIS